ncbi:unnamed protein product [Orchesella dallaii]|uniref:Leucine zipper transcription factor-like protein 1 n=1 Tax=Orchesella dallaii TaxID=48710 RepID=A0ABP1S2F5_9HEXA
METQEEAEAVLNELHKDLISEYLRFSKYQQEQRLKSIDYCFTKLLAFKIREDETYTGEEVNALLDDLHDVVRSEVVTELSDLSHTNALLLNQLLLQAQNWHLTLSANIADLEDQEKITKMRQLDEELSKDGLAGFKVTVSKGKRFQPVDDMNVATALKMEVVRLTAENDILKSKLEAFGVPESDEVSQKNKEAAAEQASKLAEELSVAQNEIDRLMEIVKAKSEQDDSSQQQMETVHDAIEKMRAELESSQRIANEQTEKLRKDLEARESKLRQVQSSLLLAEKELDKKFQATGAYTTMKKILQQKNCQIKALRKKLVKLGALEDDEVGDGDNNNSAGEDDI